MKRTYSLFKELIAYILLINFFLQSCGGSLPNPHIQPLIDQQLTAEGGHIVTCYQEDGKLHASVEMNTPQGFNKTYERLPVYIEQGAEIASLPGLNTKAQESRIGLQLAKGKQLPKVIIYKQAGLVGGGKRKKGRTHIPVHPDEEELTDADPIGQEGQAEKVERQQEQVSTPETFYQRGEASYVKQDYHSAFECYKKAALGNHPEAQQALKKMLEKGEGVFEKLPDAFKLTKMDAKHNNNVVSCMILAWMYQLGKGVHINLPKAIRCYQVAANKGLIIPQYELGCIYAKNPSALGISRKDELKAYKWFKRAAGQGYREANEQLNTFCQERLRNKETQNPEIQYTLGWMYKYGIGVEKRQLEQAVRYFKKAAKQGHIDAQYRLANIYLKGWKAATDHKHSSLRKSYNRAFGLYTEATSKRHIAAKRKLASMYSQGYHIGKHEFIGDRFIKDPVKAEKLFLEAAQEGDIKANFYLGALYQFNGGDPKKKDEANALRYYKAAAKQGHIDAQCRLAEMYNQSQDFQNASKWYREAANQGHSNAQFRLAEMYENGIQVERNNAKAAFFYSCASRWQQSDAKENGYADATLNLAWMYENGIGVARNMQQAIRLYELASRQTGSSIDNTYYIAQFNLGRIYYQGIDVEPSFLKAVEYFKHILPRVPHSPKENEIQRLKNPTLREWHHKAIKQGQINAQKTIQTQIIEVEDKVDGHASINAQNPIQTQIIEVEEEVDGHTSIVDYSSLRTNSSQLEVAIIKLKKAFPNIPAEAIEDGSWRSYIPAIAVSGEREKLSDKQQKAIVRVGTILQHCQEKYFPVEKYSKLTGLKSKVSEGFHNAIDFIKGEEQNSLTAVKQKAGEEYTDMVVKLRNVLLNNTPEAKKHQAERLTGLELDHQTRTHPLRQKLNTLHQQTNLSLGHTNYQLYEEQKELSDQLARAAREYKIRISHIEDPVQSALNDFYDWKRAIFNEFLKAHIGSSLITFEAIALGAVDRKSKTVENASQILTSGATFAAGFAPMPGVAPAVALIGGVFNKGIEIYFDRDTRNKASKINNLYGRRGLEGMVNLSREVASRLTLHLKDSILNLTPESLNKLAMVATTQMFDHIFEELEALSIPNLTSADLLLLGITRELKWYEKITNRIILEKGIKNDKAGFVDVWEFLNNNKEVPLSGGKLTQKAVVFVDRVRKYATPFTFDLVFNITTLGFTFKP